MLRPFFLGMRSPRVVTPQLLKVGEGGHPLVIIDGFSGDAGAVAAIARSLGPFPRDAASYYPGVRREIAADDRAANEYVETAMRQVAPLVAGAFDCDRFDLLSASFSVVATPREQLQPMQRAPHFDSPDPDYVALLHYLSVPAGSGTAFFRQRSTGIERVEESNLDRFVATAKADSMRLGRDENYVQGSNTSFEQIANVDGVEDRMIFYQGGLLHSGIIPPDMPLDPDPARGRLTANFFIRLNRGSVP